MVLAVSDSPDEATYVPLLERAGYVLRIREPDWYQHRVFKGPRIDITCTVSPMDVWRSTVRRLAAVP